MKVLLGRSKEDTLPDTLDFLFSDEAHVSMKPSHYEDVNVIGMVVLTPLKATIFGKTFRHHEV